MGCWTLKSTKNNFPVTVSENLMIRGYAVMHLRSYAYVIVCSIRPLNRSCLFLESTRIVGGQIENPFNSHPWHALVIVNDDLCGGTILGNNFVLTAAHCVPDGVVITSSQIVAGAHTWCNLSPSRLTSKLMLHISIFELILQGYNLTYLPSRTRLMFINIMVLATTQQWLA